MALSLLLASLLCACDPQSADDILAATRAEPFLVTASTSAEVVRPDGEVEVRFSRALDARSVGQRSIRVVDRRGRRVRRVRLTVDGERVRVRGPVGTGFPAGAMLELRIAGRPSPRAVRSTDGAALVRHQSVRFRVADRRERDLQGPHLMRSEPADGATQVLPGSHVVLWFSETLSRGSVVAGDGVELRVDGRPVPATLRLSARRTAVSVRPSSPLPPASDVEVVVQPWLNDAAGNPLDEASERSVRFTTAAGSLHEISEDFESDGMADAGATTAGWGSIDHPGFLVGTPGRVPLGAVGVLDPSRNLGPRDRVHFQVVIPGEEIDGGFASALRVMLVGPCDPGLIRRVRAAVGRTPEDQPGPSFADNLEIAFDVTEVLSGTREELRARLEPAGEGHCLLEIPFESPLPLVTGRHLLLDVTVDLDPRLAVAASPDPLSRALVAGRVGADEPLLPAAYLLASGGGPRARSLWYDSGAVRPQWRSALVLAPDGAGPAIEYQTAPADADGRPDATRAGDWEGDLADVPEHRFVRFRVRFVGAVLGEEPARIDRIVLPFER